MLKRLIKKIVTFLIIYTPAKEIISKIIIKRGYHLKKPIYFFKVLENIFWEKYFCKIKNPYIQREITNKSLLNGNGEKWAKIYFDKAPKNFNELKKIKVGKISGIDASPIYREIYNFIKKNELNNSKTSLIQIGSCSGSDLLFFENYFKKIKYISTDINNEIINFQKKNIKKKKILYFKCYADEINKCIEKHCQDSKNLIIFSIGSLQYVNPFFLKKMHSNLTKKFNKKINLFINEPILNFKNKDSTNESLCKGSFSFSHNYDGYFKKFKLKKKLIISPYSDSENNYIKHYYSNYEFFLSKM